MFPNKPLVLNTLVPLAAGAPNRDPTVEEPLKREPGAAAVVPSGFEPNREPAAGLLTFPKSEVDWVEPGIFSPAKRLSLTG